MVLMGFESAQRREENLMWRHDKHARLGFLSKSPTYLRGNGCLDKHDNTVMWCLYHREIKWVTTMAWSLQGTNASSALWFCIWSSMMSFSGRPTYWIKYCNHSQNNNNCRKVIKLNGECLMNPRECRKWGGQHRRQMESHSKKGDKNLMVPINCQWST